MKAKIKPVTRIKIEKTDTNKYPYLSYEGWNDEQNPYASIREMENGGDSATLTWHVDAKTRIRFDFSCTSLAYCCGITEIGDITIGNGIPKEEMDKIFAAMLEEGSTFMINTIPDKNRAPLVEYLKTSKYFTAVKTFKNPGTRNEITIWISNN